MLYVDLYIKLIIKNYFRKYSHILIISDIYPNKVFKPIELVCFNFL